MKNRNCVYIMSNVYRTTMYVGVTSDMCRRRLEHQMEKSSDGFCGKYRICDVVYLERFDNIVDAIAREKQIKEYSRARKMALIKQHNPTFASLPPPFFSLPN